MVSLQPFKFEDLWEINRININYWTETYSSLFYFDYCNKCPQVNYMISNNSDEKVGYIIGLKRNKNVVKGHVVALTISVDYRRLGLGYFLMEIFEKYFVEKHKSPCVGLYVRTTNVNAQNLYKKLGYFLYKIVTNYYSSVNEDGYDFRKRTIYDTENKYVKQLEEPVPASEAFSDDEE